MNQFKRRIRMGEQLTLNGDTDYSECPICFSTIMFHSRYPNEVCSSCKDKAVDPKGRGVVFSNVSFAGGIQGRYREDDSEYCNTTCYIDDQLCEVKDGRFGGVIIELVK